MRWEAREMDGREVFRAQKLIVSTAPLIDLATGNPKDRGFVIVHGLAVGSVSSLTQDKISECVKGHTITLDNDDEDIFRVQT